MIQPVQSNPAPPRQPVQVRGAEAPRSAVLFGTAQKESSGTRKSGSTGWQSTVQGWFKQLNQAFLKLCAWLKSWFQPSPPVKPLKTQSPKSPEPISHVDPKLKADPFERTRVAYAIADEVFPELVRLYQEKPHIEKGNLRLNWQNLAQDLLTHSVQKHLNTKGTVRLDFLRQAGTGHLGEYGRPERTGPQSFRQDLGHVIVSHPCTKSYDLRLEKDRQAAYATFVHEIRHLVRGYALDICYGETRTQPTDNDPVKSLYKHLIFAEIGAEATALTLLSKMNPHLPPLDISQELSLNTPPETLQQYWPSFRAIWERKDYPLLDSRSQFTQELTDLFRNGNSDVLESHIHCNVIEELESYMTAVKRAPGISTYQVQPSDYHDLARALHLRDLLRYYYEVRQIPKNQQHPFAEVKPLQLIT